MNIPDYVVHYNRGEPFRSISDVSSENLQNVLTQLNETNSWGLNRFSDPEYLPRRIQVEKKIRLEFLNKGGKPELEYPIYFFLGKNAQFESHPSNVAYKINLSDIPHHAVSFTYGDSMFSMCENYRRKLGDEYQSHLCAQVYRVGELRDLFLAMGGVSQMLHVECQLWIKPSISMILK